MDEPSTPPGRDPWDARVAPLAGAGVLLVTAGVAIAFAAPAPHWLDSSEFAAASFELGNAHPPGHPLPILLGKALTLLPLGPIAFRVGCASALALGFAALALLFAIHRASRLLHGALGLSTGPLPAAVGWPVAASGALGLALGPAALYQGVRPEVYALNLAITAGMLHLGLRLYEEGRGRDLWLAALLAGLGAGNHHLLTLATVPAVALAWLLGAEGPWRRRARQGVLALGAGLAGLLVLSHLPARSTAAPEINWGAPHTAERFGWTVSARLFQRTAERSVRESPGARLGAVARASADELGGGTLLAALAGLVLLGLRRRLRGLLAVLALAAAGSATAALLGGFEPRNPDSQGYLLLALAVLALLAAATLAAALGWLRRRPRLGGVAILVAATTVVWPAQGLAGALPRADLRGAEGADAMAEALLDSAPPRALVMTSYYQTGFAIWAARILSGARPDLEHLQRTFLAQPGYRENLLRRRPGLAPLLAGVRAPGDLDATRLGREIPRRPVLFEFDDDTFGPAMIRDAEPWGGLWRLRAPGDPRAHSSEAQRRRADARWARLEARLAPSLEDPATRTWLLWASYLDARMHAARNDCAGARRGYARARALGNPGDPMLERLRRRCGLNEAPAPR